MSGRNPSKAAESRWRSASSRAIPSSSAGDRADSSAGEEIETATGRAAVSNSRSAPRGAQRKATVGALTNDEVELVSEHFDTLALTGLLPEKEVKPGDAWRLPNDVVLALAQFEALISHDLTAKLTGVADGFATGAADSSPSCCTWKTSIVLPLAFVVTSSCPPSGVNPT